MRAVVQRVLSASVTVDQLVVGTIERGLVVLLGVGANDEVDDGHYVATKIRELRVFEDENGKLNHPVIAVGGAVLLISQFTLYGDVRRGRRPSFDGAARAELARMRFDEVAAELTSQGVRVVTGVFQAHMQVALVNDGPVTILVDSQRQF
ncbi:MAG: D-aminoacyl-tRNA deacylase [Vicinamibacterales bacterium]